MIHCLGLLDFLLVPCFQNNYRKNQEMQLARCYQLCCSIVSALMGRHGRNLRLSHFVELPTPLSEWRNKILSVQIKKAFVLNRYLFHTSTIKQSFCVRFNEKRH